MIYFMYMTALSACMLVHHVHAWGSQIPEENTGSLGTRATDGYDFDICGFWEPNPCPLQELPVLLTAKLSL